MNNFKNVILTSANIAIISSVLSVDAQGQEAGSVAVGGFDLTPTVNLTLQQDNNVISSSSNAIDSWVTILNPQLVLSKQIDGNQLTFGARATAGTYHSSRDDNYQDYTLFTNGNFEFDRRNRIAGSLIRQATHDARGTSYTLGVGSLLDGPDLHTDTTLAATYSYGALSAIAKVDVNASIKDIDYDADTLEGISTRPRDRKEKAFGGTFYYEIAPATDLTLDAKYSESDYVSADDNTASLDSQTQSLLAGVKWEATAATRGFVKLGMQKRDFDDATRDTFSGVKWEAGVNWNPIVRTEFGFSTTKDTRETNGTGDFISAKNYAVSWKHEWLERFTSNASVSYSTDDYEGAAIPRTDKIKEFKLNGSYQYARWLKLVPAISYFDRSSNGTNQALNYDKTLVSFTAQISL